MVTDVTYLYSVLNQQQSIMNESKSTALITRDLLGGGGGGCDLDSSKELDLDLHVPSGFEKRLDFKMTPSWWGTPAPDSGKYTCTSLSPSWAESPTPPRITAEMWASVTNQKQSEPKMTITTDCLYIAQTEPLYFQQQSPFLKLQVLATLVKKKKKMASISTSLPISSPSLSLLQKPTITARSSPVLRLPSMSKMGKVRCSVEGKPDVISNDSVPDFIVPGKNSWPELVGEKGEVAKAIIEKENPLVNAIIISGNSPTTDMMFVSNRVRVVVNAEGLVTKTPIIG
ncbi:uncharacterized protein LOC110884568 [Helianthus annuus]|nr:uncharacterized protein LOC110884568 [Helianthus annuus]